MDKRRIKVRLSDTDSGLILNETSYDLNFWYENNRKILFTCLQLYIDKLRQCDNSLCIEFMCFKDEWKESTIPF